MEQVSMGVCWFDDPKNPEAGWASEAGQTAFRVNGYHELSQECIWVSNVDSKTFREFNLHNIPNLRESSYMRVRLDRLARELGINGSNNEAVEILSSILDRAIRFGYERFAISPEDKGYRYSAILASQHMPGSLRQRPRSHTDAIEEALRQSTQHFQSRTGKAPYGASTHTFIFPRMAYSNWLLTRRYPMTSNWKPIKFNNGGFEIGQREGSPIKGTAARLKKLEEINAKEAMVLKVKVLGMDGFYVPFASFGAGYGSSQRHWATLPEIIEMARYSHLKVEGGFKTDLSKMEGHLLDDNPQTNFSFSKGIFYENVYSFLGNFVDGRQPTGLAAYLRAYDRIACLKIAEAFSRQGINVGSFGTGMITLFIQENQIKEAAELGLSLGLVPPLDLIKDISVESHELDLSFMDQDLCNELNNDFVLEFIRALAPVGMATHETLMDLDAIYDLNEDHREDALAQLTERLTAASEKREEGGEESFASDDVEVIDL